MNTTLFPGKPSITVRALFVGERIDVRAFQDTERLAETPLLVRAGRQGCAVLFRYGAVVLFELQPQEQAAFLDQLRRFVTGTFEQTESEDAEISIETGSEAGSEPPGTATGGIRLADTSIQRLQLVADVLAKSVVLARYERQGAQVFDAIEPLAGNLRSGGRGSHARELLYQIGNVLTVEHKMIGRAEVTEKPDLLWDHPELERLHARLVDEYELLDRHRALDRKLELIARTAGTVLDLLHHQRSLRVEWYIVILIVIEIVLLVYELFMAG